MTRRDDTERAKRNAELLVEWKAQRLAWVEIQGMARSNLRWLDHAIEVWEGEDARSQT